jgi:hypothetical protein
VVVPRDAEAYGSVTEIAMPSDATFAALTNEIAAAREALLRVTREYPRRWWSAYDLKQLARNGWSAGAMSLALSDLIDAGALDVGPDLRVRLRD